MINDGPFAACAEIPDLSVAFFFAPRAKAPPSGSRRSLSTNGHTTRKEVAYKNIYVVSSESIISSTKLGGV